MFEAVYAREEEKSAKRTAIEESLKQLVEKKKEKLVEVEPLSPEVLAFMQILIQNQSKHENTSKTWAAFPLFTSTTKSCKPKIPWEVKAQMEHIGAQLIRYKAGPWTFQAWHEGKCKDCRAENREVTSEDYEGENPISLKFQDKDGTRHRVEVNMDNIEIPTDSDDADWECIDDDQSIGTLYMYITFAVYPITPRLATS